MKKFFLPAANVRKLHSLLALIMVFFSVTFGHAQVIPINQTFSSDTIFIPFTGSTPVYSLFMSGGINLLSDSSLVRVVLIDTYGNHYLVYESYSLITTENAFDTLDASDETTFLDGVICDSLRIDVINAFLDLDSLKLDTNYIPNAIELQTQAKWDHDSVKIDIMNQRIAEEQMYWRAGRSIYIDLIFQEREGLFGNKYNGLGFEYYIGGIFEFYIKRLHIPASTTIVSTFDWRDRHGANHPASPYFDKDYSGNNTGWLTPIKSQLPCNTCYLFSPVGAAEAVANLYYNIHDADPNNPKPHLDLNLSELQIFKCFTSNKPCTGIGSWGQQPLILDYMLVHDVHEESCFEYTPTNISSKDCSDVCTDFEYNFRISGYEEIIMYYNQNQANEIALKESIITKGPMGSGLVYNSSANPPHYMTIFGFGIVGLGDIVYHGTGPNNPDIVIDEECPLLGSTFWYFKNSYLNDPYRAYNGELFGELLPTYYIEGVSLDYTEPDTDPEIMCSDEDGDGYYWWGISQTTPCSTCPPGVNQQEDCDDNNPNVGPYNKETGNELPLYVCLPNCEYDSHPVYITSSTSWNEPKHFNRNVSITNGNTLTINTQVTFGPFARIIVNPGATLIINYPAVLTISPYCSDQQGYLWEGIYVLGDPSRTQTDPEYEQGKVILNGLSNNEVTLIENAKCGINMFNPEFYPDGGSSLYPVGISSGGVSQANYAVFKNCKVAVRFNPYRYDNISYFRNCIFKTENALSNGQLPDCFIRMDGVNGVEIKNCTFQNTRTKYENPFGTRGKGIYCFNSSLTFAESNNLITFQSLDYGIYALNGATAPILHVNNCNFQDNQHALYVSGSREAGQTDVKYNQFYIGSSNHPDGISYMLYLDNCSGYKVRNNSFSVESGTYGYTDTYIGVIINNSGPDNNWIYRNEFINLTTAIQSQNQNREEATPALTGLRLLCNNYTNEMPNVNSDIKITYDEQTTNWINGIARNQKNIDPNIWFATQEPAGNTFTLNPGSSHYDIFIDQDLSVNEIIYYHHPDVLGSYKLMPTLFSDPDNPKVTTFLYNITYDPPYSCPENYDPQTESDSLKSQIVQSENKIDSLQEVLSFLIDEGSTDSLNTEVLASTLIQSYDIYQDLMSVAPYLSDTVMETSITKEDVLPNVMIRDIMVANPHTGKSDNLLTTLDNRINPMPDSLWFDIIDAADSLGGKEILESELDSWIQIRDICFNRIIDVYRNDTIHPWAGDSLVSFLNNEQSLKAKYNLIYWYIENRDFQSASDVLQTIPIDFDLTNIESLTHQKLTVLVPIMDTLANDSLGFICPDSVQTAALLQLISDIDDLPGNFARNILLSCGLISYEEPIASGTTLKLSKRPHRIRKTQTEESFVKVYPNPCRDYLIAEYLNKDNTNSGLLELKDLSGRTILSFQIPKGYNQTIIPLSGIQTGLYYLFYTNSQGRKSVYKIVKSD